MLDNDTETRIDLAHNFSSTPSASQGSYRRRLTPMLTGPVGSVISRKDVQSQKAPVSISVRLGGSVISRKDVHPSKA